MGVPGICASTSTVPTTNPATDTTTVPTNPAGIPGVDADLGVDLDILGIEISAGGGVDTTGEPDSDDEAT